MKRLSITLAFLMVILAFAGCTQTEDINDNQMSTETVTAVSTQTTEPKSEELLAIEAIMQTKLFAINSNDRELYLTTVGKNDPYYYNEQGRWFNEMTEGRVTNVTLAVDKVDMKDDNTLTAVIHQTHTNQGNNEDFDLIYPLLFIKEDGQWMDYGYDFCTLTTDRFIIKYQEGEPKVEQFQNMIETAYDNLEAVFTEKPDPNFQIKLFYEREMLRQRTVPSVVYNFTGWGEPNESLKIYTGHDFDGYPGILQHELVHHITINVCNNNLPPWIIEGIAMYYGNAQYPYNISGSLADLVKDRVALTIDYLDSLDLYVADLTIEEVHDWYNASFLYVYYIVETYGHDKLMEMFSEAGKKPFNDSVTNENFDEDNLETMDEVLMSVLGITTDELTAAYLEWHATTDFFDMEH